ncbi:hypothetical protein G8E10_24985 [Rhizobiaceae bacterium CRRU44]|uniref:Uncharacterized protein n=1 Tax=Ferranicluibacter rubi TaxID=2715133 RepID=A0AA43ZJS2_9HYPH|nr:hypothetical protein [Ferranicluibacter rubi]NHT78959.1 hypothetical protein [Ferranicluibacter rubi]
MSDIYVNSPAWMRPELPLPRHIVGSRIVGGKKEAVTEVSNYIAERIEESEFRRPTFIVKDGPEDLNAYDYVADVWDMVQRMVPWARCVQGPTLKTLDRLGQVHSPKSFIADSIEQIEGSGLSHRITNLVISTTLKKPEAIRAVLALIWRELETVATHGDAYGHEWAEAVTASLNEVQAYVMLDGEQAAADRRTDAFVVFALNTFNGGDTADRSTEPALCYRVFASVLDGGLGEHLAMHRNGFE